MLAITSFPRRFPTASKRPLRLTRSAPSSSALTRRPSFHLLSPLQVHCTTQGSPSFSSLTDRLSRHCPQPPPSSQSSAFASSAASVRDDIHDSDDLFLYGERPDEWFTTARNPRTDPTFPGVDRVSGRLSAVRTPDLRSCSHRDLLDYLDNTWVMTDALFATLQGERAFLTPPPHQLRHPLIFYYGHPTSFFVNKLVLAGLLPEPINPYFEHIFEVGVDEMRWDDMSKNEMQWPHAAEVLAYRRQVYERVRNVIETHPDLEPGHEPITEDQPLWALMMALEHERIHQETTSMLMLEHPVEFFQSTALLPDYHESVSSPRTKDMTAAARHPVAGVDYPENEFLDVAASNVLLGKPRDFPSFGWDNEYGYREVKVPACRATKFLVSNGEFYDFVQDGGYTKPSYWSKEGWAWRSFRDTKAPAFWVQDGPADRHGYRLRVMFDVVSMPWSWPAQVNLHEAQAFCQWKQSQQTDERVVYHLTTEAIHQQLRNAQDRSADTTSDDILMLPEHANMATAMGKNLNWSYLSFSPVDALPPTSQGFHDVFGNAWEWCEDAFAALLGFRVHPYYKDFSEPCFDGQHHVIMGGSFASAGDNGASKFARYHFRPHFFQHAGFRLVERKVDGDEVLTLLSTSGKNASLGEMDTSSCRR
uniref:Sulfatase-modifying factor enzyme domain-containing protein n=1 Tax=Peronospora matthiolae TaxID=2874970 RepID=A0AAV1VGB5_9STRA